MPVIMHGGLRYSSSGSGGSDITITPIVTSGTKIADFEIDGVENSLYTPQYNLPSATDTTLGGVKVGDGLDIDTNGILSVEKTVEANPSGATPTAILRTIKIGEDTFSISGGSGGSEVIIVPALSSGIKIADYEIDGVSGILYAPPASAGSVVTISPVITSGTKIADYEIDGVSGSLYMAPYTLPKASDTTLGGIKVGNRLSIDENGVLSADNQAIVVDDSLSDTSEHPVQNKVIKSALDGKSTVIANPTGTPTDELEKIQIGNDIYEITGGGGSGSEFSADVLFDGSDATSLQTSITLTAPWSNYDAIAFVAIEYYQNREYRHTNGIILKDVLQKSLESLSTNGGWIDITAQNVYSYAKVKSTTEFTDIYGSSIHHIDKVYGLTFGEGGGSDLDAIEITQANYNLLTPEEKSDPNKIYFISDGSGGGDSGGELIDPIIDISSFTNVYDTQNSYGNSGVKINEALSVTNEVVMAIRMNGGWDASGSCYYNAENKIGAYGGYEFNEAIKLSFARFYIGRYSGQNKTVIITIQYLNENDEWTDVEDLNISTSIPYPINYFDVSLDNLGKIYGIRWIHKKEPVKTSGNNAIFFGMILYKSVGGSSSSGGQVNYSTTEQVIGTWVDGKPLYQKTIIANNIAVNRTDADSQFKHGVSDIEMGLVKEIYYDHEDGGTKWKTAHRVGGNYTESWAVGDTAIYVHSGEYWNASASRYWMATIIYTKTTD